MKLAETRARGHLVKSRRTREPSRPTNKAAFVLWSQHVCLFLPLSPHWPSFGSVVFFAPLRFVLRSLGVALRLVSVVEATCGH